MAGRGSSDDLVRLAVVGGIGYAGYDFARKGKLGAGAKKFADEIAKLFGFGGGGSGVSEAEILAWAAAIGLSPNVGRMFVAEFKRLPTSRDELVNWANSKGYRRADGTWVI